MILFKRAHRRYWTRQHAYATRQITVINMLGFRTMEDEHRLMEYVAERKLAEEKLASLNRGVRA